MKANGTKGLLTCCIRPGNIFGPGGKNISMLASSRIWKFMVNKQYMPMSKYFITIKVKHFIYFLITHMVKIKRMWFRMVSERDAAHIFSYQEKPSDYAPSLSPGVLGKEVLMNYLYLASLMGRTTCNQNRDNCICIILNFCKLKAFK